MSNTVPQRSTPAGNGSAVQSVDRAAQVLEILAESGAAGVTEIAQQLAVHKSTAFRLVAALERRDLVEQDGDRGKYRLGAGLLRLAGATMARLDVVQEARPIGRSLAARTGETVNLAVLSDGAVLYLDQVTGPAAMQLHNWVGQRVPAHATANGRVLLAALTDDQVAELVAASLTAYTPATLTSVDELLAALELVRASGHAVAVDELEIGLTAIAAPIRSLHGDTIASISVSGPTFRLGADRLDDAVAAVSDAGHAISHRLGWAGRWAGG